MQSKFWGRITPRKLAWLAGKSTMHEDVFPIENADFPMSCQFSGVYVGLRCVILTDYINHIHSENEHFEPQNWWCVDVSPFPSINHSEIEGGHLVDWKRISRLDVVANVYGSAMFPNWVLTFVSSPIPRKSMDIWLHRFFFKTSSMWSLAVDARSRGCVKWWVLVVYKSLGTNHLLRMVMEPKYLAKEIIHPNQNLRRWLDPYKIMYCNPFIVGMRFFQKTWRVGP